MLGNCKGLWGYLVKWLHLLRSSASASNVPMMSQSGWDCFQMYILCIQYTSRTRTRRVAEVSRFKDSSQLCSVNSSSYCLTPFQLWPPLLSSLQLFSDHLSSSQFSQLFSRALKVFHLFPPLNSFHLFPASSPLFSTLLNDSRLCPPLLSPSQLISTLLTPCHLFSTLPTASHLRSTDLTSFPAHLNSCHLLSTLLNSCQLFWPLLTSFYRDAFTQGNFYTQTQKLLHREAFTHSKLSHREAFTHRSFSTQQAFTQRSFYTQEAFTHSKLLHAANFYTEKLLRTASFYTEELLHREAFTHSKLSHREAFTHRSFYTEKLLHTASFYTEKLSHRETFTQSRLLHRASFYTEKLLHTACATATQIAAPQPDRRPSGKITMLKHFLKGNLKGKSSATLMQPLQSDLRISAAKDNNISHAAAAVMNLDAAIPLRSAERRLQNSIELRGTAAQIAAPRSDRRPSGKTTILKHFLQAILEGKSLASKWIKIAAKTPFATFMQPLNTIYDSQLQNTLAQHQQRTEKATWRHQLQRVRADRAWFHAKAATPEPVAHASQLVSAIEPPFTGKKTQCFVQILTFKSYPWCSSSNAICQRLAKHNQNRNFAALLYSSLPYSPGLCSALFRLVRMWLNTMIFVLVRMWLHDLLRHMPTEYTDLWASENVTSWSLKAHANWPQCSLG